jgi:hypothetical protein
MHHEMTDSPERGITTDELRGMLRVVNLTIAEERLPLLRDEFNAQLGFARLLDTVLDGAAESSFDPFDPTFPKVELEDAR